MYLRSTGLHRTDLSGTDVVNARDDLTVTSLLRTAWDVAVLESTATAVGVLDAMVRAERVSVRALADLLARGSGRWGLTRVRSAFDLVDARSESPPESWVRVACALAGLPAPVPQYEVVEDGVWLARVDLAWPEARVIVEYEGVHHFDGLQIVRDDVRLARLAAAGWQIIRLAASDLRAMHEVVARIREALDAASAAR